MAFLGSVSEIICMATYQYTESLLLAILLTVLQAVISLVILISLEVGVKYLQYRLRVRRVERGKDS